MGKSKTSDAGTQKVTFFSKPDKAANNAENKSLAQIGVVNGNAKVQTSASRESNNIALQNSSLKEQELYQSAFDLLQAKKYDESAKRLKAYLNAYPDGIYAVNSHYWLGQIYFLEQHYSTSASEFSTIITKYPESSKVPDAMLQLAFIHDKQGKHDQAMKEFSQVKKKFPKSVAARLADQQLKTSVAQ
jgi:tol-pal system protein YbgF